MCLYLNYFFPIDAKSSATLGMIGGWLVFPALTQSFKTEVLGFKAPPSGTKFAFEKEAVGENVEMTEGSVK